MFILRTLFPNLGALPGKMSPRDVLCHHNLSHFPPSSSPDHFNQHTATVKAQEVELCQVWWSSWDTSQKRRDEFGLNLSFSCSRRQAWYIPQFINKEARGELINTTLAISAQYWIYWAAAARCRLFTNSLSASTSCSAKSFVVIFFANIICLGIRNHKRRTYSSSIESNFCEEKKLHKCPHLKRMLSESGCWAKRLKSLGQCLVLGRKKMGRCPRVLLGLPPCPNLFANMMMMWRRMTMDIPVMMMTMVIHGDSDDCGWSRPFPKLVLKWQIDAKTSASGRLLWQFFRNLKQKSDVGRKGPWPFYRNLNIVFLEIFSSSGQQIFKSVEV